jgi:hypothetical protein
VRSSGHRSIGDTDTASALLDSILDAAAAMRDLAVTG